MESENEEGEINEFEMENPVTPEKNGYKPISTSIQDELNLHNDGEITTGEIENKYFNTENSSVTRSNRKCIQTNRYGGVPYTKNFWM